MLVSTRRSHSALWSGFSSDTENINHSHSARLGDDNNVDDDDDDMLLVVSAKFHKTYENLLVLCQIHCQA